MWTVLAVQLWVVAGQPIAVAPDAESGLPAWVAATWLAGIIFIGYVAAGIVRESLRGRRESAARRLVVVPSPGAEPAAACAPEARARPLRAV